MSDKRENKSHYNRLQAFFDASNDPMFVIDLSGTIIDANSAGKAYVAEYSAESIGTNVYDLMEAHPLLRTVASSRKAMAQEVCRTKKGIIYNDSYNNIVSQFGAYPVFSSDGEVIELFITIQDITLQCQKNQEISDLQTQWDITSRSCHIGLWKHDIYTNNSIRNAEHARIFGYDPNADVSWSLYMLLDHIVPEDRPGIENLIKSSIATQSDYFYECRIRRIDGEIRWIYAIGVFQYDDKGKPIHVVGSTQDITDYKELKRSNEQLQEQVRQSQKMELLGQLAGGIAHDFNNVLMAIQGNTELILNDTPKSDPHYQNLISISTSLTRSSNMVKQLLAFARKQPIRPTNIELDSELDKMRLLLRGLIRENISLRWNLQCPHVFVNIDPTNLTQIITNLYINARDAIAISGSITIKTTIINTDSPDKPQFIESCASVSYIRITVSDTGAGIDPKVLPHIYEPFFTTKGIANGTGLGLSMVYGLVKQNNGHISCETEIGKGTTFDIIFPIASKNNSLVNDQKATQMIRKPYNATVLVVEDQPEIVQIIKLILEKEGYVVLVAGNAEDAMAIADSRQYRIHMVTNPAFK